MRQNLTCNLLFGLIGQFGLLQDVNISFFLSWGDSTETTWIHSQNKKTTHYRWCISHALHKNSKILSSHLDLTAIIFSFHSSNWNWAQDNEPRWCKFVIITFKQLLSSSYVKRAFIFNLKNSCNNLLATTLIQIALKQQRLNIAVILNSQRNYSQRAPIKQIFAMIMIQDS